MKYLFVSTISNTVNAFLIPHIRMLINNGHNVELAFHEDHEPSRELILLGCHIHQVPFNRNPISLSNFIAYRHLKRIAKSEHYDIVHTHTPIASAIVRIAFRNNFDSRIIYTAHGFHFYNRAPIKNWLLYFPLEYLLSAFTDTIITINKEDYNRAKKILNSRRVEYIPGVGVDLEKIKNVKIDKEYIRNNINPEIMGTVILSVGELNKNKNHGLIIKALSLVNRDDVHYLICGDGPLKKKLFLLTKKLGIEKNVHILGYRNDIIEICKSSDIFAFPSKREGLGIAAIEAMACGLPLITSNLHGIVDYTINGVTGFSINPINIDMTFKSLKILVENKNLATSIGNNNINLIEKYSIESVLLKLKSIYGV